MHWKNFTGAVSALVLAFAFANPAAGQLDAKALLATTVTNNDGLEIGSVDVGGQLTYDFDHFFAGASATFGVESGGSVLSHERTSIDVGTYLGPIGGFGFVGRQDNSWNTLGVGVRLGPVGGIVVEGRLNFVEAMMATDDMADMMEDEGGRSRSFEIRLAAF